MDSVRQASIDELVRVKGISETLALTIKEQLNTGESV
ncbi:MAG UNVERIFIED_CONTAM: hypothetical protein LVT10_08670 [Anaerolineae bacterium]